MELLVVSAIIALLAALLLVAVGRAKARARLLACANNVRQCGIGLQAYVTDYNGYPLTIGPPHSVGVYWMSALQNTELTVAGIPGRIAFTNWAGQGVWKCPAATTVPPWPDKKFYWSYGYNSLGLSAQTDTDGFLGLGGHGINANSTPRTYTAPVHESEIASPAEMMAIGDGLIGGNGIVRDGELVLWRTSAVTNYAYPGCTRRSYALHQGLANVVYCDGHVASPSLKSLFQATDNGALSQWNRDHQPHPEKLN